MMKKINSCRALVVCVLALSAASILVPATAEAARRKYTHIPKGKRAPAGPSGVNDPRYAAIIMDPITGEVFHSKDADGIRYPASLTKMMTLYLLFEALAQRRTTMEARLDVSEKAATMPQTNLALAPGDTIPVDIAIKALIVRSANDVAWVVGEALGGDIDNFSVMMTAKARQLGMRNTVFKNPNGLPNTAQRTTARDMAKLGIALKRDFPQYYPLFQTRQFSWEGVTYYTHNRVMLRYPGTDGIKTGFVNASGFNLVSSVVRGGRPLVGVVMGGGSGRWRDDRMIELLDGGYQVIVSRGAQRGKIYAANLPLRGGKPAGLAGTVVDPTALKQTLATTQALPEGEEQEAPDIEEPADIAAPASETMVVVAKNATPADIAAASRSKQASATPSPFDAVTPEPVAKAAPAAPAIKVTPAPMPAGSVKVATSEGTHVIIVPKNTVQPTPVARPATTSAPAPASTNPQLGWGIQVGAFSTQQLASQAAQQAMLAAPKPLAGAQAVVVGPGTAGAIVYRARLQNLSQLSARKACEALITNNTPCFIYASGRMN